MKTHLLSVRFVALLTLLLLISTAAAHHSAVSPAASTTARQTSDAEWKQRIIGRWKATGAMSYIVEYKSDGSYTTPTSAGYWDVKKGKLVTGRETRLLIRSKHTDKADIVSLQGNVLVLRRNGEATSYERVTQ